MFSPSLDSCEVKERTEAALNWVEEINDLVGSLGAVSCVSYAVEIVDYMHAKSHLYDVAKVVFGETETEAIACWIQETEPFLSEGNIREVVACIRTLETQNPEVRETLVKRSGLFLKTREAHAVSSV